jgi:Cft2 family RNA processing exonuclease
MLYTGDFKLRAGLSSERAEPLPADLLVMESTFGLPRYVFPDPQHVGAEIRGWCRAALARGAVPVLLGYSLGKAQEIQMVLRGEFRVAVHPAVALMNHCYADFGIALPPWDALGAGHAERVLVLPPSAWRRGAGAGPEKTVAMVSGWGLDDSARFRYGVEEVFPLSDHADFPELLRLVELVKPRRILTTHGWHREFAATLRRRGLDAWSLHGGDQMELFTEAAPA